MKRLTLASLFVAACSGTPHATDPQPVEQPSPSVHVKVLGINDFHGHLEGPSGKVTVDGVAVEAGGAAFLAQRIAEIRKYHPNTIVVGAGDMIGASPLLSALFHDEPAIEALNEAGMDINAVGNHEFDEGVEELMRIKRGGCHPEAGCFADSEYKGANFEFLAANVRWKKDGETIFPAYSIREFDGVKVGFIGLTLEGTPAIVDPKGITDVTFHDEAESINLAATALKEQGVRTIVVLIHEGGYPASSNHPDDCEGISGPILEIVAATDVEVDLFVTGHTHQPYVCTIGERLVTSAKSFGQAMTEVDLHIDRATGDVTQKQARNLVIDRTSTEHPGVVQVIEKYKPIVDPLANRAIGEIKADFPRETNADGESLLGRLIADIQLHVTSSAEQGGAQIAFMNPGGIRADLLHAPEGGVAGTVTYAQAHTIQPFGNSLVTMTLTGAQIHELLEQQWKDQSRVRLLQVSKGFSYTWTESAPEGKKVDPKSIKLNGKVLGPEQTYRVTVNSFIAAGGDGFTVLIDGTNRLGGPVDVDAFVAYLGAKSPLSPSTAKRITRKP
jgi:5'-nucleotidase